jgi:hypothetical protein
MMCPFYKPRTSMSPLEGRALCACAAQVEGVTHRDGGSTMRCGSGTELRSAAALDATGHALKLVEFDQKFDPGYQVSGAGNPLGSVPGGALRS